MADDPLECLYATGDRQIAACSRVLSRDPKDALAYKTRGVAYCLKDDYDRAISDYDQAVHQPAQSS
ncbi:MAG: hypothetical protein J2P54_12810 [Bradyrhizobiaceae bacterium]|nr:hypothetical protein [Bradyrhizobiaceae bacterium]